MEIPDLGCPEGKLALAPMPVVTRPEGEEPVVAPADYSPIEVHKLSRAMAAILFDEWPILHRIVSRHEEKIRKRWLRKTVGQRKEILLKVEPNIPSTHRPDKEFLLSWPKGTYIEGPEAFFEIYNSLPFLVPHINQEDLSTPTSLLKFLNSRGRHSFDKFAHTEIIHCPVQQWPDELMWDGSDIYTMAFRGRTDPQTYGELLIWESQDDARKSVLCGHGLHPAHGIQVLRIQIVTIQFLIKCCEAIMHEIPLQQLMGDMYPELPEPSPLSGSNIYAIAGRVDLESPYRAPMQLDYVRMRALISARIGELEDHLWGLREDPGYFREVFDGYDSHRPEHFRYKEGLKAPRPKSTRKFVLSFLIRDLILNGYTELYQWHECLCQVVKLEALAQRYASIIAPDADLPEDYFMAIRDLWKLLHAIMREAQRIFQRDLPASPPLRRFWQTELVGANEYSGLYQTGPRQDEVEKDNTMRRVYLHIRAIVNIHTPPLIGFHTELDDLQREMDKDPAVSRLITPHIARTLSPLSISVACVHQLLLFQPWAGEIEQSIRSDWSTMEASYKTFMRRFGVLWVPMDDSALISLADPSDGKFDYPITQRRDEKVVWRMRTAEANLDKFWKKVDEYCSQKAGRPLAQLLDHDITRGRKIQRTPPWIEPPKTRKQKKGPTVAPTEYTYQPFSLFDHDATKEVTGAFDKLSIISKEKPKTRGATTSDPQTTPHTPDAPAHVQDETQVPDKQPEFRLNRRAYKVFKALFHSPNNADIPGDIPWTDFLHAMVSTGFTAEKLHGSAWQFTPKDLDVERSIQFHEPHPDSKLPFTWARRYGRRLARAYGWNGEMFKLA